MTHSMSGGRPIALVVDDEPLIEMEAVDVFHDLGYEAIGVRNACQSAVKFDPLAEHGDEVGNKVHWRQRVSCNGSGNDLCRHWRARITGGNPKGHDVPLDVACPGFGLIDPLSHSCA